MIRTVRTFAMVCLACFVLVEASCGEDPSFGVEQCSPGDTDTCECSDGSSGETTCGEDSTWGECDCSTVVDTDPLGDGVLLLIDRSSSMDQPEGEWDAFRAVLSTVFNGFSASVDLGLIVFPDNTCDDEYEGTEINKLCRIPDNVEVDIAANTTLSIIDSLEQVGTCGGTPISGALLKAADAVESYEGNVQVILVTDGLPNCNLSIAEADCECPLDAPSTCEGQPEQCVDRQASVEAAQALRNMGATLHVVGKSVDLSWESVFDDIAEAGGTNGLVYCSDNAQLQFDLAEIFGLVTG